MVKCKLSLDFTLFCTYSRSKHPQTHKQDCLSTTLIRKNRVPWSQGPFAGSAAHAVRHHVPSTQGTTLSFAWSPQPPSHRTLPREARPTGSPGSTDTFDLQGCWTTEKLAFSMSAGTTSVRANTYPEKHPSCSSHRTGGNILLKKSGGNLQLCIPFLVVVGKSVWGGYGDMGGGWKLNPPARSKMTKRNLAKLMCVVSACMFCALPQIGVSLKNKNYEAKLNFVFAAKVKRHALQLALAGHALYNMQHQEKEAVGTFALTHT
uniref:Uncharacterized protein n=1 Tax=Eutreptiella gymnastica TaxID=73025 RepID=A0A7S1IVP7_9EUGL|mmetsp:Transcript_47229/g.84500  ORF Transcript_47229/g.84500 Transcript_47229/m.84500 type:complete len:262 (+) Transcript_47229:2628-3413(+)